jgi:hypothetical protein
MFNLQRTGGVAAIFHAMTYVVGIVLGGCLCVSAPGCPCRLVSGLSRVLTTSVRKRPLRKFYLE